jgi:hypothetical protein
MNEDLGHMMDLVIKLHEVAAATKDERIALHLRESANRMSEIIERYKAPKTAFGSCIKQIP